MSALRHVQALALAALAAAPAHAADVTFGGRTELWYDDNVLGTEDDEVSDGELLISPTLGVSERFGTVDATLNLTPTYELFFDQKDLRGFNYRADGSLVWTPTARTRVELRDDFWRYRSLRLFSTASAPGGTPAEAGARDRFTRNVAQLVATHRLTPVDLLQLSGSFSLWDFSNATRFDQNTGGAALNYQRSVTRTLTLGGGASFSRTTIERRGITPERHTDYFNFSLIANYEPADTFFVRASAGPTYVRQTRQRFLRLQLYRFSGNDILVGDVPSTCPTLPTGEFFDGPGCNLIPIDPVAQSFLYSLLLTRGIERVPYLGRQPDRDDYTYFADVSLEKAWESATLSIGYRRDEGSNSGAGFTTVADTFELRGSLRPRRDLGLSAAIVWEDREETQTFGQYDTILDTLPGSGPLPAITNLVPVGVRLRSGGASVMQKVETLAFFARADYRLSARARLDAAFSWREQRATAASLFNDYERFQLMLGVTVELEPWRW